MPSVRSAARTDLQREIERLILRIVSVTTVHSKNRTRRKKNIWRSQKREKWRKPRLHLYKSTSPYIGISIQPTPDRTHSVQATVHPNHRTSQASEVTGACRNLLYLSGVEPFENEDMQANGPVVADFKYQQCGRFETSTKP